MEYLNKYNTRLNMCLGGLYTSMPDGDIYEQRKIRYYDWHMITDDDVKKLKETFATKNELIGANSDIAKLKVDVAILKTDVAELKVDVAELKVDSKIIQNTLIRMEQKMDDSIEFSQKNFAILEGLSGKVADLDQENRMGAITLRRHGIQIHELAKATGTTISE